MSLRALQRRAGIVDDGVFGKNTFKHCSKELGITDHSSAVHFWAQVSHETGNFVHLKENLNYSTDGLLRTFGRYFRSRAEAKKYARSPKLIASRVYADRMGNGDEASMDGWTYRGRGALQLTGKNNYKLFAKHMNNDCIVTNPDIVADELAFESAMFFFETNNLWAIACKGVGEEDVRAITRRINGGFNGIAHRLELTNKFAKYTL